MLTSIIKAQEDIQEPMECPAMTREIVGETIAYPVKAAVDIGNLSVA